VLLLLKYKPALLSEDPYTTWYDKNEGNKHRQASKTQAR
jgi:hypothetical protein